jgi:hypothetical protein
VSRDSERATARRRLMTRLGRNGLPLLENPNPETSDDPNLGKRSVLFSSVSSQKPPAEADAGSGSTPPISTVTMPLVHPGFPQSVSARALPRGSESHRQKRMLCGPSGTDWPD